MTVSGYLHLDEGYEKLQSGKAPELDEIDLHMVSTLHEARLVLWLRFAVHASIPMRLFLPPLLMRSFFLLFSKLLGFQKCFHPVSNVCGTLTANQPYRPPNRGHTLQSNPEVDVTA